MQQHSILVVLLWLCAAPLVSSLSVSAATQARLFLRAHVAVPPNTDQLADLRTANPEAYAIVKALLTKRSLGLLDPRHPTASFAKAEKPAPAEDQGPEVFQKMASPSELRSAHTAPMEAAAPKVDMPYAEVAPAAHHDWMNWKPQNSGMDDEQMVQNVLGAVAELKGGKKGLLSKSQSSSESTLVADEASMGVEQAAPVAAPVKPVAPAATHENSYLKSVDFGLRASQADNTEKPVAAAPHENSYLKGLDLSGDMPKVVASSEESTKKASHAQSAPSNYLSSFSWDDSKPQQDKEEVQQTQEKVQQLVKGDPSKDSLLSWLGVVKKAPVRHAPPPPSQPSNPYIMDLS